MEPVRVGVIGVGAWGMNHARVLASLPEARVTGFFDVDDGRSASAASQWGGKAFPDQAGLLCASEAVLVAVPTTHHCAVTMEALGLGVHTLVEKPIASSLDEADRMEEAAREADRVLMVGHLERFNPAVEALLGVSRDPRFVEIHRLSPFDVRGLDVSVVLDLMIHDLDILLRLAHSPLEEVRAVGVPVLSPSIDIANARLRFDGGCVANLTASRISLAKTRKIRIFERDAYISLNFTTQEVVCYRRTQSPPSPQDLTPESFQMLVGRKEIPVRKEEPLKREIRRFLAAVRGEKATIVTAEEGREALAVALQILGEIHDPHETGS